MDQLIEETVKRRKYDTQNQYNTQTQYNTQVSNSSYLNTTKDKSSSSSTTNTSSTTSPSTKHVTWNDENDEEDNATSLTTNLFKTLKKTDNVASEYADIVTKSDIIALSNKIDKLINIINTFIETTSSNTQSTLYTNTSNTILNEKSNNITE